MTALVRRDHYRHLEWWLGSWNAFKGVEAIADMFLHAASGDYAAADVAKRIASIYAMRAAYWLELNRRKNDVSSINR